MKVHGKDAVAGYDSEDSDTEEAASSPTTSLPLPLQQQQQGGEWYCHAQSLPTPPSEHNSPGLTNNVKFETHQHTIGGIIGNHGY